MRKENRDKATRLASKKAYRLKNGERLRAANKAWRDNQPKKPKKPKQTKAERNARRREYEKKRRRTPRERARNAARSGERQRKIRQEVLGVLGAVCIKCGNEDQRVLQIDHIHGDGYKLKKASARSLEMRRALVNGEVHQRYQVLCANCHCIKTWEGGEGKRRQYNGVASLPLFEWLDKEAPVPSRDGGATLVGGINVKGTARSCGRFPINQGEKRHGR